MTAATLHSVPGYGAYGRPAGSNRQNQVVEMGEHGDATFDREVGSLLFGLAADRDRAGSDAGQAASWAPADACTLPTAEQPTRLAEFDALFATGHQVQPRNHRSLRLHLGGGGEVLARTADLAARESACCSFFEFTVTRGNDADGEDEVMNFAPDDWCLTVVVHHHRWLMPRQGTLPP